MPGGTLRAVTALTDLLATDRDAVDDFVSRRLEGAGIWEGRASDGVDVCRVVEHGPARVQVCGRIYHIDQTLFGFWLVVDHLAAIPDGFSWGLSFDAETDHLTPRRARNLAYVLTSAEEVAWRVKLSGHGTFRDGRFTPTH